MVPYLTWFSRQETLGSTDPPYYSVQEKFISGFISVILSSELDVRWDSLHQKVLFAHG